MVTKIPRICMTEIFRDGKSRSPRVKNFKTEERAFIKITESIQELIRINPTT